MRAFFAEGVDKMHVPWAVEGLPMLLHLSLFLFFGGLAIFLFNVHREVFTFVICWIGLFSMVYGLITLLPIIRPDSPYHSPLSTPVWFLHATMTYVTGRVLTFIVFISFLLCCLLSFCNSRIDRIAVAVVDRMGDSLEYYRRRMFKGVEEVAEEKASKRSSDIDVQILEWTISALGDDDSLKDFFEIIPRSFNSKMLEHLKTDIPETLRKKIKLALRGFCHRALSSDSISDSEKLRRLDIAVNALNQIGETRAWLIEYLFYHTEVPQTVEMGHILVSWLTNNNQGIPLVAEAIVARTLVNVRERNGSWVALAARVFRLPERDLRDNIALGGDSVLLAILLHLLREDDHRWWVFEDFLKLDIRNTHPRVQHDFCMFWNAILQAAREQGGSVYCLKVIRHLYIALHQDTCAALTAFPASTDSHDDILDKPSSYPFCNLVGHHPDSTTHVSVPLLTPHSPDASSHPPTDGGNTALRQSEQVNEAVEPPSSSNSTTTSEIGATSHGPDVIPSTNLVHSSSHASPTAVPPQNITLSPLEGSEQQDSEIVAPSAVPGTGQFLPTASTRAPTPTLTPIPTSLPNTPSESYDPGVVYISNSSPPSVSSSIPAPHPTDSAMLPRLRARGLVNTKNTCFANAILQLLINSPPFWNLFKEFDDLKGQRGVGVPETGGGATPLVGATVRFFKEFMVEESASTQRQSQPATGRSSRAADEEKKDNNVVDSFEPTYLYDAMKEKRQLRPLLVRSRAHITAPCC
jgi:Family of unknown function (DUF6535)/Ubiquitin carboxyl-terminal hydrolase